VTQQLAGHSDILTTLEFYLSVQADDLAKAKQVQDRETVSGIVKRCRDRETVSGS
jgi:hypothetical protein